jgi:hypothetical protein
MSVFHKEIYMRIFFPNFFDILKFVFRLKGAYAPGSRSAFPIRTVTCFVSIYDIIVELW